MDDTDYASRVLHVISRIVLQIASIKSASGAILSSTGYYPNHIQTYNTTQNSNLNFMDFTRKETKYKKTDIKLKSVWPNK